MTRAELGVYINGNANGEVWKAATSIKGPRVVRIDEVAARIYSFSRLPQRIIVAGGEGSIGVVIQEMANRRDPRPLGLLGGGTQNVLRNELIRRGRVISIEEFRDITSDSFPEESLFHPGKVRGGRRIFNNQFATGAYETANGRINRALKFIPRKLRPLIVRSLAGFAAFAAEGEKLDMFSVVPNIGNVRAFPEQDLFSNTITHAWIPENSARKLAAVLFLWWRKVQPGPSLLRTEQRESFISESRTERAWIDGDTVPNPVSGRYKIIREDMAVPITALWTPAKV